MFWFFKKKSNGDGIKTAFSKVRADINKLASWMEYFNKKNSLVENRLDILYSRTSEERIRRIVAEALEGYDLQPKKKKTIKSMIIKRIKRQSKDYLLHSVTSLIQKFGKVTALQLRDMVVDEQGLCSKSSFYRILEEVEDSDDIAVIKKGKNKLYMLKAIKKYR